MEKREKGVPPPQEREAAPTLPEVTPDALQRVVRGVFNTKRPAQGWPAPPEKDDGLQDGDG